GVFWARGRRAHTVRSLDAQHPCRGGTRCGWYDRGSLRHIQSDLRGLRGAADCLGTADLHHAHPGQGRARSGRLNGDSSERHGCANSEVICDGPDHLPRRNVFIAGLAGSVRIGVSGVDTGYVEDIADSEGIVPMTGRRRELEEEIPLIIRGHLVECAVVEDAVLEAATVDIFKARE